MLSIFILKEITYKLNGKKSLNESVSIMGERMKIFEHISLLLSSFPLSFKAGCMEAKSFQAFPKGTEIFFEDLSVRRDILYCEH